MSSNAPAAAYLATKVLPSSITSGGVLPANALSYLVPMSAHCWVSTFTVMFGYFALKSAFTPSTTDGGALPFISQMVRVPVSFDGLLLDCWPVLPHAATSTAAISPTPLIHAFLRFI